MKSESIANNYEEAFEEFEQESPLLMQEEILRSENRPQRFFEGLIFALPIILLTWGIFIFILWFLL
jgi:hypothetical protein